MILNINKTQDDSNTDIVNEYNEYISNRENVRYLSRQISISDNELNTNNNYNTSRNKKNNNYSASEKYSKISYNNKIGTGTKYSKGFIK
jgi:hypothetical protein